jgi:hypothetical protein
MEEAKKIATFNFSAENDRAIRRYKEIEAQRAPVEPPAPGKRKLNLEEKKPPIEKTLYKPDCTKSSGGKDLYVEKKDMQEITEKNELLNRLRFWYIRPVDKQSWEIKDTPDGRGKGLYAKRNITNREFITAFGTDSAPMTKDTADKIKNSARDKGIVGRTSHFINHKGTGHIYDNHCLTQEYAERNDAAGSFANEEPGSSKNNAMIFRPDGTPPTEGRCEPWVTAIRDINKGEEITIDYGKDYERYWQEKYK